MNESETSTCKYKQNWEFSYESVVERILKMVHICQSYWQISRGLLFLRHSVYDMEYNSIVLSCGNLHIQLLRLLNWSWRIISIYWLESIKTVQNLLPSSFHSRAGGCFSLMWLLVIVAFKDFLQQRRRAGPMECCTEEWRCALGRFSQVWRLLNVYFADVLIPI